MQSIVQMNETKQHKFDISPTHQRVILYGVLSLIYWENYSQNVEIKVIHAFPSSLNELKQITKRQNQNIRLEDISIEITFLVGSKCRSNRDGSIFSFDNYKSNSGKQHNKLYQFVKNHIALIRLNTNNPPPPTPKPN